MARLNISDGSSNRVVELTDAITVAGRAPENKLVIDDKQASRRHFQIEKTEFGYKVVDLESRNGTRVNDRPMNQALLRPGDRIQIGKHVLTFEDPSFKEPPAEVAARFAPPTPGAPAVAPASGLPVATEAPKPVTSRAVINSEGQPELRTRRRGGTTAIQRTVRAELRKEQQTLTMVAVGAGVFIFILVLLVLIPSGGGESPAAKAAQEHFNQAQGLVTQQKYDEALAILTKIPADQKGYYAQAQNLAKRIEQLQKQASGGTTDAERKEFDELYDFCEKNRANPNAMEKIYARCLDFKKKYPQSTFTAKVDEYFTLADERRKTSRRGDLAEAERQAQEDLKKNDFASALKKVKAILTQYSDEIEVRQRIVKFQDEALDKARLHFQAKRAEAEDLKARARKDEARAVYQALIISMGDSQVEELVDYCKIAKSSLEAIP